MVQTRSAAKRIEHTDDDGPLKDGTTVDIAAGNSAPRPAKKPRREGGASAKKRRRGKPSELCQLNLDVLFLIAAYLHPIDLLNLARTCKSLRELLMDKSSAFVWKTAFRQVKGLPACPADLTEPEYANLVFYARCHGCGKYTTAIFWNVRRRYCPGCRIRHLRRLSSCNEIIRKNKVLPVEYITAKKETAIRVDKEKAASFMHEYRQSSNKSQFISDEQERCSIILQHARRCEAWQKKRDTERKRDLKENQQERSRSIFHRLQQHGYGREIGYFGHFTIERSRESDFRTSKPLTDKEWEKRLPEWVKIMNNFRSRRLEEGVYRPRRGALVSAYRQYVTRPPPDAPTFDLLPHVADLACFHPFRDILKAPEETRVDNKSFSSAFAQLPVLVSKWKESFDAGLTELVKIPLRLSSKNGTSSRIVIPGSSTRAEASNVDPGKLQLACALFRTTYAGVFNHFEVFSVSMLNRGYEHARDVDLERPSSISDRFGIQFLEEGPYIVHTCGLDPNVATTDDMDRRNARLKCLSCEGRTLVMNWRHAMLHASSHHQTCTLPLSKSLRWQLVGEEHIDAIQSIEQSIERNSTPSAMRCLLCRPRVGDVICSKRDVSWHLYDCHKLRMDKDDIKRGVHYAPLGLCHSQPTAVEMVEEGEQVTFRVPTE